jgi:hypothetical protein
MRSCLRVRPAADTDFPVGCEGAVYARSLLRLEPLLLPADIETIHVDLLVG